MEGYRYVAAGGVCRECSPRVEAVHRPGIPLPNPPIQRCCRRIRGSVTSPPVLDRSPL
jgi:hypothetical protein